MTTTLTTLTINDQQLWTITAVVEHLGIGKATFTSYVSKGIAPAPVFAVENTRLWNTEEVKTWHAMRPGSPIKK